MSLRYLLFNQLLLGGNIKLEKRHITLESCFERFNARFTYIFITKIGITETAVHSDVGIEHILKHHVFL